MNGSISVSRTLARGAVFLLLGVLVFSPPLSAAAPAPVSPTTERLDQVNMSAWPRWTPQVAIDRVAMGAKGISVAVDSWGITYAVWAHSGDDKVAEVVYANSRWATRRMNGFSTAVRISRKTVATGEPVDGNPTLMPVTASKPWIETAPTGSVVAVVAAELAARRRQDQPRRGRESVARPKARGRASPRSS